MTRVLATAALVLVAISVAGQLVFFLAGEERLHGLIPLFDLDQEQNLPTVFSMLLLVFSAQLLGFIASLERRRACEPWWRWGVLSAGLLFMAVDEVASLHEKLIVPIRSLFGERDAGIFYYAWVIPGIAMLLLLAPLLFGFLRRLPPATRRRLLAAGALYLAGALGGELVGGAYAEAHGTMNLAYSMITTAEESLEMAGAILLVRALLAHLGTEYGTVLLGFGPGDARRPAHTVSRDGARRAG